jgi:hypothetical protein
MEEATTICVTLGLPLPLNSVTINYGTTLVRNSNQIKLEIKLVLKVKKKSYISYILINLHMYNIININNKKTLKR